MEEKTNPLHNTIVVTRAMLTLIAEEMKRQGVERVEDLKPTERSQEEIELRRAEIRELIEDEPIKPIVPKCVSDPGYESGLAASMTEEQKNCPYCHKEKGSLTPRFLECNYDRACAWIELDDKVITFDNTDGDFTNGEFKIDYCPKCGRMLEAKS